ncbi:GNAT family N-acetyltransferase [Pseudonocardia sp.]|uniref:GNAT family N-acetyltransferase n=1 Tax=Pseudonocardia sp. TaxID=60912 RepID=UPI003D1255E3
MSARVDLLADEGRAASADEFFRHPGFLDAEGVTHTLVIETDTGRCAIPLVVRDVPGTSDRDAVSPYGYPGATTEGDAPDAREVDLSGTGLVTAFIRDGLGAPSLAGGTARGRVMIYDPALPRTVSKSYRRDVRRNEQDGYSTEVLDGRDVDDEVLEGFAAAYAETMSHVGAATRYEFSPKYLRTCLDFERSWLAVTRGPDGDVAAAELLVGSDGVLHSYLAGTRTAHRMRSPGKNATVATLDLADRLAVRLNHGGGLTPGDGIEASKRSYTNTEASFVTHELVCDPARYAALSSGDIETGYFPSYRAPAR